MCSLLLVQGSVAILCALFIHPWFSVASFFLCTASSSWLICAATFRYFRSPAFTDLCLLNAERPLGYVCVLLLCAIVGKLYLPRQRTQVDHGAYLFCFSSLNNCRTGLLIIQCLKIVTLYILSNFCLFMAGK